MNKVGIIGLGLIGGSLAKAIRKNYCDVIIVASDVSENSLEQALLDGVINKFSIDVNEIFCETDIVFVCTSVDSISSYIKKVAEYVSADCIITDVGSVKGGIYKEIFSDDINYIGGHPMAGSEKFGYENSNENLFVNAYYILTPSSSIAKKKVSLLESIVRSIGAIPITMDVRKHDFIAAVISHAPHVIAASIVNMVNKLDDETKAMHLLAGGGFRDITRIASSNPEMWQNISFANKTELLTAISEFRHQLDIFEEYLEQGDILGVCNFFEEAKQYRDGISCN